MQTVRQKFLAPFIRAGTILPLGPVVQYVSEKPPTQSSCGFIAARAARSRFVKDQGDNYNYEKTRSQPSR